MEHNEHLEKLRELYGGHLDDIFGIPPKPKLPKIDELCPFCGGDGKLVINTECGGHGDYGKFAAVQCKDCGARGRRVALNGYYGSTETEEDAIISWNHRV